MKRKTSHVITRLNGFGCMHCGMEYTMNMPAPISVFAAAAGAFVKEHARCEKGSAGQGYTDVYTWYRSWDTGQSSKTIFGILTGYNFAIPKDGPTPRDPSDLGRCIRLLRIAPPDWRGRLTEVSERFPHWNPVINAWDELVALYDAESPSGTCPKLYDRMKELRGDE